MTLKQGKRFSSMKILIVDSDIYIKVSFIIKNAIYSTNFKHNREVANKK